MKINMETNTRQGDGCTGDREPLLKRHRGVPLHGLYTKQGGKSMLVQNAGQWGKEGDVRSFWGPPTAWTFVGECPSCIPP